MASILSNLSSVSPELDRFLDLVKNVDWASTYLGSIQSWPQELLLLFDLSLVDPQPRVLLLGPQNLLLYNAAYAALIGERHPAALGRPIATVFPETKEITETTLAEINSTGHAAIENHFVLPLVRDGSIQEVHMSWVIIKIPFSSDISGFSIIIQDETEKRIAERRISTLRLLSHNCALAIDFLTFWSITVESLREREYDCPFALLYGLRTDSPCNPEDDTTYQLHGHVGNFGNFSSVPDKVDSDAPNDFMEQLLLRATTSEQPVVLRTEDGSLPRDWSRSSLARGFQDSCKAAVILPLRSHRYNKTRALLIIGLGTRMPYDDKYQNWIAELSRVFGDSMTAIVSSQETIRKKEAVAEQLAIREKEANKLNLQYQRLIRVMELSDVGVFECDPEGNLLQANTAWFNLSGYPPELDKSAFSWLDYVHQDDSDLVMKNWHAMMTGTAVTYEMRWKTPGVPEGRWILAVCLPVIEDGRVTSISGCTTDIDAQKKVEKDAIHRAEALERASASEQRFLRFTASSPVAVHIIELPSMTVSYCNDIWFEMTGHPRVPWNQIDWGEVFFEGDLPLIKQDCADIISTRKSRLSQFRFRKMWIGGDGHRYQCWGSSSSHPELDEDGNVKAIMTTTTDISHLKWAEDVQRSRVEEALEAKRQQENFIDMTSHEIRNPLGAVVHCADAIHESLEEVQAILNKLQSADSKEGNRLRELIANSVDAVDTISSCSAHQKRIVDDLLTLSKLDSNLLQINHSRVRALGILDDMQRVFEVEADRAGIELQIRADPSFLSMGIDSIMLDTGRVHQILINLVTNAIKFTKDRKERRLVAIAMGASTKKPSEGVLPSAIDFILPRAMSDVVRETSAPIVVGPDSFFLWFSVEDTGRGISLDEKAKLFSRFSQGSPRTYSKYGGSGLGLFISRELAELQGGEIGVASEIGKGSTFAFFVKTNPASAHSVPNHEVTLVSRPRKGSEHGILSEIGPIHVLVVEDNAVNQRVLKRQLTQKGYQVSTADNGQEALEFLETTRYWRQKPASASDQPSDPSTTPKTTNAKRDLHVVLMDIEMPVLDGIAAAKRIREMQAQGQLRGHVPIMAVSANARPEQTSMAIAAGMDDSIAKPFRIADLLPKIERLANLAHAN